LVSFASGNVEKSLIASLRAFALVSWSSINYPLISISAVLEKIFTSYLRSEEHEH
jgi:hypothetical protein